MVRTAGGPETLEWSAAGNRGARRAAKCASQQRAIGVNFIDTYFRKGFIPGRPRR